MGYRIRYSPVSIVFKKNTFHVRLYVLTGLWFIIFGIATFHFWPEGRTFIQQILIPGDPNITMPAINNFLHSLSVGEPFSDAAMTLCICILEGAGLAPH